MGTFLTNRIGSRTFKPNQRNQFAQSTVTLYLERGNTASSIIRRMYIFPFFIDRYITRTGTLCTLRINWDKPAGFFIEREGICRTIPFIVFAHRINELFIGTQCQVRRVGNFRHRHLLAFACFGIEAIYINTFASFIGSIRTCQQIHFSGLRNLYSHLLIFIRSSFSILFSVARKQQNNQRQYVNDTFIHFENFRRF